MGIAVLMLPVIELGLSGSQLNITRQLRIRIRDATLDRQALCSIMSRLRSMHGDDDPRIKRRWTQPRRSFHYVR